MTDEVNRWFNLFWLTQRHQSALNRSSQIHVRHFLTFLFRSVPCCHGRAVKDDKKIRQIIQATVAGSGYLGNTFHCLRQVFEKEGWERRIKIRSQEEVVIRCGAMNTSDVIHYTSSANSPSVFGHRLISCIDSATLHWMGYTGKHELEGLCY